jgi:hypothetical protein
MVVRSIIEMVARSTIEMVARSIIEMVARSIIEMVARSIIEQSSDVQAAFRFCSKFQGFGKHISFIQKMGKTIFVISNCRCLGSFAKLRKATVSFVISVCPSVCPHGKLGSHWKDFHEIYYFSIFGKSVEKIQVSLKSGANKECFT